MKKVEYTKSYKLYDYEEWRKEKLFGVSKRYCLCLCTRNKLPGTDKWPADNPIWDCYIAGSLSPRVAWSKREYLKKAIDNLFWITKKSIKTSKYPEFVQRIKKSFTSDQGIMKEIQARFTIAKIAPKVTALMESKFLSIIEESKVDISCGIYCPMAGFGGIVRGAERWFKAHNLEPKIEAYDINPNLCAYYGWTVRDVLKTKVKTSKVVFVCPPFGPNTERWPGTPDVRNDKYATNYLDFHDWCKLIMQQIDAPNYIFVGPELRSPNDSKYISGIKANGLFHKKYGIQYYPEYDTGKLKIQRTKYRELYKG